MYGDLLARFGLDVLALCALVYGLFYPRHRRMDLVVVYGLFNVGLFVALVVIARGQVSMGVGFGLFAVLSIVRLRSEPFTNRELAYFFVAIVLGLVCAIDLGSVALAGALAACTLLATWAFDRGAPARRLTLTLDQAIADEDALRRHVELRLNAPVVAVTVREVDYVRETTLVDVSYGTPASVKEVRHVAVA